MTAAAETPWYVIRPAYTRDLHFAAETTARVFRPRLVPEVVWLRAVLPGVEQDVERAPVAVAEADGVVVGFAWVDSPARTSSPALRMVYVKRDFRGEGIGLRLLWALGLDSPLYVRETTPSFRVWARTKGLDWKVRT